MPKLALELRDRRLLNARTLRAMVRSARALAPAMVSTGRSLGHRAVLLMGTILSAHASMAQSLPQGGVVVGGSASIGPVRLIGGDDTRVALARDLTGPQAVRKFFIGRPEIFGEMLYEKVTAAGGNGSAKAA